MVEPPHASLLDDVHEDRLHRVARDHPGVMPCAEAAASADPVLRAFAETLDDRFEIVDLRTAAVGMGFAWGRYGPRTELRRHGLERVFAVGRPERRGFLDRLRGRG